MLTERSNSIQQVNRIESRNDITDQSNINSTDSLLQLAKKVEDQIKTYGDIENDNQVDIIDISNDSGSEHNLTITIAGEKEAETNDQFE